MNGEAKRVWDSVEAIYAAFLAGDRAAIDGHISRDATIWDSAHAPLLRGREELDALREARPPDGPAPIELEATDPVIDVFGNIALVRHVLLVRFAPESGEAEQRIRNTSVWRLEGGRWLCVHNHEDVLG